MNAFNSVTLPVARPAVVVRRVRLAVGVGGLWLATATALAQEGVGPGNSPHARAAQHFEHGVELYREGSLDAALVEFERAYEAVPDFRVLYNIAQVQTQRGEYVEAITLFQRYLQTGGEGIAPARRIEVEQDLTKLNARVARLWVESNAAGAEVFVNGKAVGVLPLEAAILINSGVNEIRVVKPGFEARSHQLKVAGGEQPRLSLPLTPIVTNAAGSASPQSTPAQFRREANYTPFWVSLAATAVLGGASGGLAYFAFDSKQQLDDELARLPADRGLARGHSDDARQYSLWADVCGAAAVLAAGTAVYFLVSPPSTVTDEQPFVSSLEIRTNGTSAALRGTF